MHYSMRYSLPRSYFLGGEPFVNLITNRWEMLESGVDTDVVLVDSVDSNNLVPTVGQSIEFDGISDGFMSDNDCGDIFDGAVALTIGIRMKVNISDLTTGDYVINIGNGSGGIRLLAYNTGALYVMIVKSGGSSLTLANTFGHSTITDGEWCDIVFTWDNKELSQFFFDGVESTGYNSRADTVTSPTSIFLSDVTYRTFTIFGVGYNAGYSARIPGKVSCAFAVPERLSVESATSILNAITSDEAEEVPNTTHGCWVKFDQGSGSSILAEKRGFDLATANILGGAHDTTMWPNGANESYIQQKGLGGGNYEGGIGIRMLYQPTGISSATSQPPAARSESQMSTMGNTFTFECWLYKDSAATAGYAIFASTTDQSVAVSADRVGFDIRSDASGRGFTFGAAGSSAITLLTNPGVVKNAAGWYYCALVVDSGSCTMYIAGTADSSFGTVHPAQNVGSMNSDGASGDQDLVIGGRKRGTGLYDYQLDQGCGVNDVVYFEGVALSESDLLKRFNYTKPKYL